MKRAVTIKDVAAKANVSITTVAHALNGKRPVNEETQKRVLKVVEELEYVPSYYASHLKKKCSNIIGCFAVDITQDFTSKILRGVERGLSGSGFSLMIASGVEFGGDYERACRFFRKYDVDGLIVCHHLSMEDGSLDAFTRFGKPAVFINVEYPGQTYIIPDNQEAGLLAAVHLQEKGSRHLGFLGGPKDRLSVKRRLEGFRQGCKLDSASILYGDYSYKSGYSMAQELHTSHPEVDGIFAANDYIAAGAIRYFEDQGMNIPKDVKIIGCDDREFSSFWNISITTIELPLESMGAEGIKELRERIEHPEAACTCKKLKPRLLQRESTDAN